MNGVKGWKFPININSESGKIESVNDNVAIKQSVKMILQTQIFERKIFSHYGSELRSFMFEVIDPSYISSLQKSVYNSINSCESYVKNLDVSITASNGPTSKITAEIEYNTPFSPVVEKVYKTVDFSENV